MNSYASISQLLGLSCIGNEAADRRNIESAIETLLARLAAVEAERDAAVATYTCFHCGFASADEAEATAHFGDRDEEMPLCRWWRDSTDAERAQELQSKILELTSVTDERDNALRYTELLIAERDAARAGEARAVEACQRIEEALQGTDFADHGLDSPVWNALELVRDVTADEPALAWIAQQRREAAAEALEEFADDAGGMEELIRCNISDLRSALRARAAALQAGEVADAK